MSQLKFIDKSSAGNLDGGLEYFAVGLIVSCHMENGVSSKSGKDYSVEYIDPFGMYQHEWRASDEIVISPISDGDFENLQACYAAAKTC